MYAGKGNTIASKVSKLKALLRDALEAEPPIDPDMPVGARVKVEFAPGAGGTVPRPEFGYFAEYSASKRKYRIAFDDFEEDKPWYKLNEDGLTILDRPIGARVKMLDGNEFGYIVDYRKLDGAYRIVFDDIKDAEDAYYWYERGVDFEVV